MIEEKRNVIITLPSGEEWAFPVMVVARNRADNYKDEFENDIERSLQEDTLPLFKEDNGAIFDWLGNNMDWDDVKDHTTKIKEGNPRNVDEELRDVFYGRERDRESGDMRIA